MRLKETQIARLADLVIGDLQKEGLVALKGERGALLNAVKEEIAADIRQEETLERDAQKLLEETLRGSRGLDIDRQKMLKMIKDKLARERKIVL